MEKILIIRLSSIGDILQCSGVPRVLRKRFPQARIDWLVRADNVELVGHNPHLDRVITYDRRTGFKGFRDLTTRLAEEGYTHVYDAHSNLRSHYFCARVRPERFLRRHKPRLKRFALFWLRMNFFSGYDPVRSFIDPLRPWGVENDGLGSELHLPTSTIQKVRSLLSGFIAKTTGSAGERAPAAQPELIAMAPSAAWPKKRWPLDSWLDLAGKFLAETPDFLVILGGPQDDFCRVIQDLAPDRILNLQGKLTLLESAAAAALSKTLIAADTGLLHMAEALGKRVIALIGPTPFGYPTRPESKILETRLWCKPCSKDGRGPCVNPEFQKCMRSISPTLVFETFRSLQP